MPTEQYKFFIGQKVIILTADGIDFDFTIFSKEGTIKAIAGGWLKIKIKWYLPPVWYPKVGWLCKVVPYTEEYAT